MFQSQADSPRPFLSDLNIPERTKLCEEDLVGFNYWKRRSLEMIQDQQFEQSLIIVTGLKPTAVGQA
jgi:hypothetical protein